MEAWLYLICGSPALASEKMMFQKPPQTRTNQAHIILRQNPSSREANEQWQPIPSFCLMQQSAMKLLQ